MSKAPNAADMKFMMEELKRLRTENEEFKKRIRPVTFEVNEQGGISVYGIGKYPAKMYRNQWERILEKKEDLLQYIKDNAEHLN